MLFNNLRQYLPYQTYVHTTFYHSSGLTRKLMFNGSIYCVLYLQILRFYLGRQSPRIEICGMLLRYIIRESLGFSFHFNNFLRESTWILKTYENAWCYLNIPFCIAHIILLWYKKHSQMQMVLHHAFHYLKLWSLTRLNCKIFTMYSNDKLSRFHHRLSSFDFIK